MHRQSVSSSMIKEVGWEDQTLEIEFSNGTVYRYYDVPEEKYNELINSPSIGKEFHSSIRNAFRTEKVN